MAKIDNTYKNWQIADKAVSEHGAVQKARELEQLLNLLDEPQAILEIGYWNGGTAWAWKQTGAKIVLSVDIDEAGDGILTADSHDPTTIKKIQDVHPGLFDMVFIDGDHSFASALLDYQNFKNLVTPGGIVALHDICATIFVDINTGRPCNVFKAWRIIKREAEENGNRVYEFITSPSTWGGIGVVYQ